MSAFERVVLFTLAMSLCAAPMVVAQSAALQGPTTHAQSVQARSQGTPTTLQAAAARELRTIAGVDQQDPRLRAAALQRLARSGDGEAQNRLRQIAAGAQRHDALFAAAALTRLGDRSGVATSADVTAASSSRDAGAMIDAVRESGVQAQTPILTPLLRHEDWHVRLQTLDTIGALGNSDLIPDVRALLSDEHPMVRSRAAFALAQMGDPAHVSLLAEMLRSPEPEVRLMALNADRTVSPADRLAILEGVLGEPDPLTRLKAADALARIDPGSARATLLTLSADQDVTVRREAARILEGLAPFDLATFQRLLTDSNEWVRMYAAGAILGAER